MEQVWTWLLWQDSYLQSWFLAPQCGSSPTHQLKMSDIIYIPQTFRWQFCINFIAIKGFLLSLFVAFDKHNMWPYLTKPGIWDPRAISAMRVFITSSQKMSKSRFCHIHVKQPFQLLPSSSVGNIAVPKDNWTGCFPSYTLMPGIWTLLDSLGWWPLPLIKYVMRWSVIKEAQRWIKALGKF